MNKLEQRMLIYTALIILCGLAAILIGAAAGIFTFMQIAAVIEFIYWLGSSRRLKSRRRFQLS